MSSKCAQKGKDFVSKGLVRVDCRQFKSDMWHEFSDVVSREIAVWLKWPGAQDKQLWSFAGSNLRELVLGHALLELCKAGQVPVLLSARDNIFALEASEVSVQCSDGLVRSFCLEPDVIIWAMSEFINSCGNWSDTGCFHRGGCFDPACGQFLYQVEDIGRHNCIDRLAGWSLCKEVNLCEQVLFISARATASLMTKIKRAGFRCVISRSAITTASLEIARQSGITLLGFSRSGRFTVFNDTHKFIAYPGDIDERVRR